MIFALLLCVAFATFVCAGFSTPKLPIQKPISTWKPIFQADEFGMEWKLVWSAYYTDDVEFDDFMDFFLSNACKAPKQLAVEEHPKQLLVCARPCKENQFPVIKFTIDGRRIRSCQHWASHGGVEAMKEMTAGWFHGSRKRARE